MTRRITDLLSELDALAARKTKGDWWSSGPRVFAHSENALDADDPLLIAHVDESVADCDMDMRLDCDDSSTPNAALIAALANAYPLLRAEILRLREALDKIAGGFWSAASVDGIINGNWRLAVAESQAIAIAALKGSEGGE